MSGQQQLVAAGGSALLVLSALDNDTRQILRDGLFRQSKDISGTQEQAAHERLVKLAGAVLFVAVGTLVAGVNRQIGNVIVAIVAGLLILWLINKRGGGLEADNIVPNLGAGRRQGTAGPGQRVPVTS